MKKIMILFLCLFAFGCTKTDPVETIVDHHQEHIKEVLDYTNNNFEQTIEIVFLENELEHCSGAMTDVLQAYYSRIAACNAKTDYWRLATFGLLIALAGAIFMLIKRIFK